MLRDELVAEINVTFAYGRIQAQEDPLIIPPPRNAHLSLISNFPNVVAKRRLEKNLIVRCQDRVFRLAWQDQFPGLVEAG